MLNSAGIVTVDLHGKNSYQAGVMIDSALRKSRGLYRLRIIHGYNNGTILKAMVKEKYAEHPSVLRFEYVNEGVTDIILKEY
ncbi:MAG: Smr/MutS family protein [Oscillospiraceae bacterium]